MADDGLVTQPQIEAVLPEPLTSEQVDKLPEMISQVSDMLRGRRRDIDERIALWDTDRSNPRAVAPGVVGAMLATVIKRVLVNPKGLWSSAESEADYSLSETYPGQRSGSDAGTPGDLELTAADLAKIAIVARPRGSIYTSPLPYPGCR